MVFFSPPKSDSSKIIIRPAGARFITGVANQYDNFYPEALRPYIEFDDYQTVITDINDVITSFWPCIWAILVGYLFCLVTFGLSLLIPNVCIRDVELEIRRIINSANKSLFDPKGLNMEFHKGCFVSWIQINLPKNNQPSQKSLIHNEGIEMDQI